MFQSFTEKARKVMSYAREEAFRLNQDFINTEHILIGILREGTSNASGVLKKLGIDLPMIRKRVTVGGSKSSVKNALPITNTLKKVIYAAIERAKNSNSKYVEPIHLLLGLLSVKEGMAYEILIEMKMTNDFIKKEAESTTLTHKEVSECDWTPPTPTESKTPALDTFGTDLTLRARQKKLDPLIGREIELKRIIRILSRRRKSNPVLIGEPGVGKTAIVEGLAQKIVLGEVPDTLIDKRLVELDFGLIVAGTKYRGQFEERMAAILDEIKKNKNIIIFVDELQVLIGAGNAEGALDASNILKPCLARGEIQLIGATTLGEYRKYVEVDPALERRFLTIMVEEPTIPQSIEVLQGLKKSLETFHGVFIEDEAVREAVVLSERFISSKKLPDKAIDIVDEAGAKLKTDCYNRPKIIKDIEQLIVETDSMKQRFILSDEFDKAKEYKDKADELKALLLDINDAVKAKEMKANLRITKTDIREIIHSMTGIPVTDLTPDEGKRILNMDKELKKVVAGQDESIKRLSQIIRRAKSGIKDPNRPIGCFLFLGPTGVGKTLLAKALSKFLFGEKGAFFEFDMSEYGEKHSNSKFMGAPPGYVGYEEGGQLTEKVRRHPYCVVLFDEIEKAHPDMFNSLLQVMEEGRMTDGLGRTVDFKNCIIIMTSNVGATSMSNESMGFGKKSPVDNHENMERKITEEIKSVFRPEFINRIDEIVIFKKLSKEDMIEIVGMEIEKIKARLTEKEISISLSKEASQFICDKGFSEEFGARPLRRYIEKNVEVVIGDMILSGEVSPGSVVSISLKEDHLDVSVSKKSKKLTKNTKIAKNMLDLKGGTSTI